jgi:hypothetical protein
MCILWAAIPATAAVGAKLNADQLRKEASRRLPIPKWTAILMGFLKSAAALYHPLRWQN